MLLLLGFAFRVYHLDLQAAMGDDAFSLNIARQPLPGLFNLSRGEPHPPLFYLLLHFWQAGAGPSTFAGRYLGLAFGILGLAAIYRLGRALGGRGMAFAGLLLAVPNPFLIAFSQQVRMYTLVVAAGAVSSYLLLTLARQTGAGAPGRMAGRMPTPLRVATYF
ncbi:MAG: glycosyltransferase family 39 protein, partial [Chloroflexota bacterium]